MIFRKKVPEPVTAAYVDAAKRRLQPHTNFRIDQFFDEMTVEVLFNTPLGATAECLNIDAIASAAEEDLGNASRVHLDQCAACAEQVNRYQALNHASHDWKAAERFEAK